MNSSIKYLWDMLGDIPIDDDECIEETFLNFPIGTYREEIWYWFEEVFNVSVAADLMHPKKDKVYEVKICRTYHAWTTVTVKAKDEYEAENLALDIAEDFSGMQTDDNDEVIHVIVKE